MTTLADRTPWSVAESVSAIQQLSVVPKVLETVARVTGMRFAAIARVTDDRWTACAVFDRLDFGLGPGDDLVLQSTICDEIRQHHQSVIFGHASRHPVFSSHHTPRMYGLESYVSVPIITDSGEFFGTLCAIDSMPRELDERVVVDTMELFASLVASHLVLEGRVSVAEHALRDELDAGVLREQFLAVVGHDLRSPLQGARLIADQLAELPQSDRGSRLVARLSESISRMAGLTDDIMDFARGRLGGGIPVALTERDDLHRAILKAVAEVQSGQPTRRIVSDLQSVDPAVFDEKRLCQLLSNLLNNAVTHGDPSHPIVIRCEQDADGIEIRVSNHGEPISPTMMGKLFEPFVRPDSDIPRPGLGLGLYIASEIARSHGGELTVASSQDEGTVFTFRLPRAEQRIRSTSAS